MPNHRSGSSNVMSDAIKMTYLDLSKRRQQQDMNTSNPTEPDAIPKTPIADESQSLQLTTQSSFTDISDLPTIKENSKGRTNRKMSTTTNDSTRKDWNVKIINNLLFLGVELSTHISTTPDLQIPFYCGNPLVDITKGILHLYKDK